MKFITLVSSFLAKLSARLSETKRFTLLLFILALALRLGFTLIHPKLYLVSDMLGYNEAAISLIQDGELRVKGVVSASRPPMYPYFLAAVYYVFGQDFFIVRIAQALLGALTAVVVYKIGGLMFDKRVGVLAGLFFAFYTGSWALGDMLLSEALFTLLMLTTIYFLIKAPSGGPWILFWGGVFGAAAALTRTAFFPYIPFITVGITLLKFRQPRLVSRYVFITVMLLMAIFPWMLRNYYTVGVFTMNTKSGTDFYLYNHSSLPYIIQNYEDTHHFYDVQAWNWSEVRKGQECLNWALEWIKSNPHLFLAKGVRMIMNIWGFDRDYLWWYIAGSYGRDPMWLAGLLALLTNAVFVLIAPFAIAGFFISKPFQDNRLVPTLVIICMHILTFIVYGFSRHRFPFVPLLIIWAAYAVIHWDSVKAVLVRGNKDWRKKAIIVGWGFLIFSWGVELLVDFGSVVGLKFVYPGY